MRCNRKVNRVKSFFHPLFIVVLSCICANAQYFTTGNDPLSMHLRQIKNNTYRIIYDKDISIWAWNLAHFTDSIAWQSSLSLDYQPRRIDILLHSRDAYSNGLVTWAPKRIELYPYPQEDGDCLPWMQHLIIHEYRHAIQTSMVNRGFTRVLYYMFGEQAVGAVLGVYVPLWFMEGDAVANETALSHGGRGRQGRFEQETKAQVMSGFIPSYDQAYIGSYRHFVPDYYHMGYLTVSNVRLKYGNRVWSNAMKKVGNYSFSITPFSRSLRHDTGKRKVAIYHEAMTDWQNRWHIQDTSISATPYNILSKATSDYAEFTSAQIAGDRIIAFRRDMDHISAITDLNDNVVTIPSARQDDKIAANNEIIVWCEMVKHPRWENASNSPLMIASYNGKNKRRLLNGCFSSPSISADGKFVAAIETLPSLQQQIKIIDTDGHEFISHPLSVNEEASFTTWLTNDMIAYISLTQTGKCIKTCDIKTGRTATIGEYRHENMRHLTSHNAMLFYTSDKTGIDNIYQTDTLGNCQRITSAQYGAAWPCITDSSIIYSNYTATGYTIVSTNINTRATDMPVSPMRLVADSLSVQEQALRNATTSQFSPDSAHTESMYSRVAHLFKFHSWGPIVVDAQNNRISQGVTLASQNTLGNSILSGGINWSHDTDEKYFVRYSYTALYPKIEVNGAWGYMDMKQNTILKTDDNSLIHIHYDQRQDIQHYNGKIYLPLSLNTGAWLRGLTSALSIDYYNNSAITLTTQPIFVDKDYQLGRPTTSNILQSRYATIQYGFKAFLYRRLAIRDVGYRLGLTVEAQNIRTISGQDHGHLKFLLASLYLPGIALHHNFNIEISAQKKSAGSSVNGLDGRLYQLILGDMVATARGTTRYRNTEKLLLRANYTMPLLSPDWSIGPLCYIKRINARLFYDWQQTTMAPYFYENLRIKEKEQSVGTEIWAESYWLHLPYTVNIGYRMSWVGFNTYNSELLFGIKIK